MCFPRTNNYTNLLLYEDYLDDVRIHPSYFDSSYELANYFVVVIVDFACLQMEIYFQLKNSNVTLV